MPRTGSALRRAAAFAVALALTAALAACSPAGMVRSQLSQAAGSAGSVSTAAAETLRLDAENRVVPGEEAAALQKTADDLAQAAKTLSSTSATGRLAAERNHLLLQVRAAQDAVLLAQDAASDSHRDIAARERAERRLRVLGTRLNAASERLAGSQ